MIRPIVSLLENPYVQLMILAIGLEFMAIFFIFLLLVTNREAWFWFWMRFSGKIVIAEFDDTGRVVFKSEKSIGQGVIKGDEPRDYSITPRAISEDLGVFIRDEVERRYHIALEVMQSKLKKDELLSLDDEERDELIKNLRSQVELDYATAQDSLKIANDLNRFRAFTSGIKAPFFVRYSGKAVLVNPLLATVISGGKMARVIDLKTFITKMITPSQIKYIVTLSEMIGSRQLKENKSPLGTILLMVGFILFMILVVFYGLPAVGIKVI
jgi:hypothetical protein